MITAFELAKLRRQSKTTALPFSQLLSRSKIREALGDHPFRSRVFDPFVTVWAFVQQLLVAESCQAIVARVLAHRLGNEQEACSPRTGAYVQARQRLPQNVFKRLACLVAHKAEDSTKDGWLWKGRHVKIVDGTGLTVADTPENRTVFPKSEERIHYPMLRAVGIFSLATGCILEFAYAKWSGKGTGEMSLLASLLDTLEEGDVLLADRYYNSYHLMAELKRRGVDFVFRLQNRRKSTLTNLPATELGPNDWLIQLPVPPQRKPGWMTEEEVARAPDLIQVRIVKATVSRCGFRTKTLLLVTSLPKSYGASDLGDLYRQRWACELDLRSLKRTLQMEELRCKTPEMVHKEIWANLLAYNLIRSLTVQAAGVHDLIPRDFSFKSAIHLFLPLADRPIEFVLEMMTAFLVHDRPLRHAPREVKRRRLHEYPTKRIA